MSYVLKYGQLILVKGYNMKHDKEDYMAEVVVEVYQGLVEDVLGAESVTVIDHDCAESGSCPLCGCQLETNDITTNICSSCGVDYNNIDARDYLLPNTYKRLAKELFDELEHRDAELCNLLGIGYMESSFWIEILPEIKRIKELADRYEALSI